MKKIGSAVCGFLVALTFLFTSPVSISASYTVDTAASPSPITGLWWNQNESGWGATLTQQYDVIFVTMFTYDSTGNPTWYVASNCAVTGGGCQGDLYKVTGGSMPTVTWNGANIAETSVGTLSLAFTDDNTGAMNYTINGVNGSKAITRQVWRTGSTPAVAAVCKSANFTNAIFNAITLGMTLDQVNQTIGCAYTPYDRNASRVIYQWGWYMSLPPGSPSPISPTKYINVCFDSTATVVTANCGGSNYTGQYKAGHGF